MQQMIDVSRWEGFLEHRTGVCISTRSAHVASAIKRRMVVLNILNEEDYWARVNEGGAWSEWSMLIDELVVKDTRFFRHRVSFDYLREYISQRLADKRIDNLFSLWSVGCSTGEEAWSLAMVANDCFNLAVEHDGYFSVHGTDVSVQAIATCRKAEYGTQQTSGMTEHERRYYLDETDGRYNVSSVIRDRVAFNVGNVIELDSDGLKHDVIYCQNLLIYFRRWRRRKLLDTLVSRLNVGGLLVIGPGEMTRWDHPKLKKVDKPGVAAYQKITE